MRIKVNRQQTNRSLKKPIYKYTADINGFCCDLLDKRSGGIIIITGEGVYPALRGRATTLDRYNNCPWCGEMFEFVPGTR